MSIQKRMRDRLQYLAASALRCMMRRNLGCPSCGCRGSDLVARKYVFTSLRRCQSCRLLFRAPTTAPEEYHRYYQARYTSGLTTELPGDAELERYMAGGFAGSEKNFARYMRILEALGTPGDATLLDYGASWGYGCWQFKRNGFDVQGFELSEQRADYGRKKLGVDIVTDRSQITGPFDIFFSTHVVEHVPEVGELLNFAFSKLKPGGLFVAITPNGSLRYRAKRPANWSRVWGFKHPVLLDEVFVGSHFNGGAYFATTRLDDFAPMAWWATSNSSTIDDMTGWELLIAARAQTLIAPSV